MRNAFTVRAVLKQLPVRIESATAYGDRLLLGTANGALLVYQVTEPTGDKLPTLSLVDTKKAFARKAIEYLGVIKEAGVLVCLADSLVTLYDLHSLSNATPLNNTRGAHVIAMHTGVDHIDNIPTLVSKVAIYGKRRIVVLEWRNAEFFKTFEYSSAEKITAMQFASPGLLTLSTAREFLTLQLPCGQWDDLFPADTSSLRTLAGSFGAGSIYGRPDEGVHGPGSKGGSPDASGPGQQQSAPGTGSANATASAGGTGGSSSMWGSWTLGLAGSSTETKTTISRMPGERLLLCHKDIGVFINSAGKLCRQEYAEPMSFMRAPSGITYTSSYAIAISTDAGSPSPQPSSTNRPPMSPRDAKFNVEVRNIATQALVQALFLSEEQPLHVFNGPGGKQVWAIGMNTVWRLIPIPIQQQVEDVLAAGQYDEALSLVAQSDNILESEKEELTVKIRWLRARWLFREQAKYEDALSEFTDLGATPTEAIALCPERVAGDLAEDISDIESDYDHDAEQGADRSEDPKSKEEVADGAGDVGKKLLEPLEPASKKKTKPKQVLWKDALYAVMRYLTEHRRWLQQAIAESKREIEYVVRVLEEEDDDDDQDDDEDDGEDGSTRDRKASSKPASGRWQSKRQGSYSDDEGDSLPHVRLKRLAFSLEKMKIPVAAMARVVDTTLLKVYLECSPGLLGPLLRVKNHCDVEQSEGLLIEHKRYMELVDLYNGKGLYRNALQLLQTQGMAEAHQSSLRGTFSIVRYLLRLPADQYELVLEYARWPLQIGLKREQAKHATAEDGVAAESTNNKDASGGSDDEDEDWPKPAEIVSMVFADDRPAAVAFPRPRVASYLRQLSLKLAVQYLTYVFDTWHDQTPALHDDMVVAYLGLVEEEEDQANEHDLRRQLQQFLRSSRQYSPERALARLPDDMLFEERALILSRLGRHEQALCLLVFSVTDLTLAEKYCVDNIDNCANVFVLLLGILVSQPPSDIADNEAEKIRTGSLRDQEESSSNDGSQISVETTRSKIHRRFAGHLLSKYHQNIPANDALRLLPSDMEFTHDIFVYLRGQLCALDQEMRVSNVVRNLRIGEDFQAKRQLQRLQSGYVVVSDTRTCPQCLKRIGSGTAFAVIPPRGKGSSEAPSVVHYSCWQRQKSAMKLAEAAAKSTSDSPAGSTHDEPNVDSDLTPTTRFDLKWT
ncbi:Vacuolar morphogenesis protein 6 [Coemansia sp. RSA 1813]|nr:Vacuolar morphogenesis protein 6 [Coemansia sp. RSA 1843]KAJ2215914.1 Vacuolar morphogenesis protein 6 [Coemansia sp. RSA 487]KAJ2570244.1 Vacuolar morphogenesis protein 6 [Coemansia sp. RSA 1813]